MELLIAKNSGFCFGVEKAVKTALQTLDENKHNVFSLGPIIHNEQVINLLESKGLKIINDIKDIDRGKVIIRSHGIPLNVYSYAKNTGIELIDCTCPFVRNVQKKANEFFNNGYTVVIIGNPNHPEVIGINGWCNNQAVIVNSEDDINKVPIIDKLCIVSQTTMTLEKFQKLSNLVQRKGKIAKIFNTICNATSLRQESTKKIAKEVEAMIVIGGYHSSNTRKLAEISKKYCGNVYHIETINDLPINKLKNFKKIGITAGASTPDWIIKDVVNNLKDISSKE
ncbi:4-hydroxy-3-methylbut-2-enyl diphosphate reductase [Caloranaerobacter azorensis H53214]|uniref:4-hydroxy-3-methylbut-2-enyl diphosphate reductase n=1 Tax=Caloranaerobacter azorensis H53214 TaxID=1156417 RepID=A0A096CT12_9FIRM|nr:4-hydroxy-3-methylbut-2-enyl diphosphate reductase [Caloranaerobacter azorensis]KGG79669.1 4-hydroxy-3-methylbut-2-enyl diphosphate reductase [Caloranaerobacter azorensis H53214]